MPAHFSARTQKPFSALIDDLMSAFAARIAAGYFTATVSYRPTSPRTPPAQGGLRLLSPAAARCTAAGKQRELSEAQWRERNRLRRCSSGSLARPADGEIRLSPHPQGYTTCAATSGEQRACFIPGPDHLRDLDEGQRPFRKRYSATRLRDRLSPAPPFWGWAGRPGPSAPRA
jgi:hypothetical protein